jgi:hypothetical protein
MVLVTEHWPNHAPQRIQRKLRGCNRRVPCAWSLSLGRQAALRQVFAVLILFAAACAGTPAPAANEDLLVTGFPDLPSDARQVAERLASCSHFAGEFNGDGSDRDKEVASTMTGLRCDSIERDVSIIRQKHAGNRAVQEALDAASQL